jgi:hypothetical protein
MEALGGWFTSGGTLGELAAIGANAPYWFVMALCVLPAVLALWTRTGPVIIAVACLCALLAAILMGVLPASIGGREIAASVLAALIVVLLAHGALQRERRRSAAEVGARLRSMEERIDQFLDALDRRARTIDQPNTEDSQTRV